MAENGSPTEESELTPKQEQFIAALVAGNTIAVAAAAAGIGERTAYTWMKQPHFKDAFKDAKQDVFDQALDELRLGVGEAISTLKRNMAAPESAVQVRAALGWINHSLNIHRGDELERMHKEILRRLDGLGVKP